ncbi:hypothetical protein Spico_1435 [Parasphaerochaeta coccoides DSM 17374]|uniref:PD-(D/E)XK endonuclease-like domain-containing protein n=2 Tax=Parasphaerochaeta TaxID=3062336 RepID=F4GI41_PARC1|nr:hypothetical protein Spico_1435 [Parasphaerochaeta coccoides DSM 17374]
MDSHFSTPRTFVHSLFDTDSVLVFPSEISARFWLEDYALHGKSGVVRADRALAWDTFRARFLPVHAEKLPANSLVRMMFAREFLEGPQGDTVPWFASSLHPETFEAYTQRIARLLPRFADVLRRERQARQEKQEASALVWDDVFRQLAVLHGAYEKFLVRRNLFEPSYETPSLAFAPPVMMGKKHVIVFSQTIPGVEGLLKQLGNPSWIQTADPEAVAASSDVKLDVKLDVKSNAKPDINVNTKANTRNGKDCLHVFANQSQEVGDVVRRLRTLAEKGVPAREMAVTVPVDEILVAHLREEARLHDLPLRLIQGFSPLEHPAGRFFTRLKAVYDTAFSLQAMKDLLLDIGIPWRDIILQRNLLARAIELRIEGGDVHSASHDAWFQRLSWSEPDASGTDARMDTGMDAGEAPVSLRSWYGKFRGTVISVMEAETSQDIRARLSYFQQEFFCDERWEAAATAEATAVYTFCMENLEKVAQALQTAGITRYHGLFSLFLSHISQTRYVPQSSGGIPVYVWPQSATLMIPHHYAIGLGHDVTLVSDNSGDFLPETVLSASVREEHDMTAALFSLYRSCVMEGRLSLSSQGYNGVQLPPSCMVESGLVRQMSSWETYDSWKDELKLWRGEKTDYNYSMLSGQRAWYRDNAGTVLTRMSNERDVAVSGMDNPGIFSPLFHECDHEHDHEHSLERGGKPLLTLSSTQIDAFASCPFSWALKWGMGVRDDQNYEVPRMDHRFMGRLIHKVYQLFFEKVTAMTGLYDGERHKDTYQKLLLSTWGDEFMRLSHSNDAPSPPTLRWIKNTLDRQLPQILDQEEKIFSGTLSWEFEKNLEMTNADKGYHLVGKIDRIVLLGASLTDVRNMKTGAENNDAAVEGRALAVVDYKKGNLKNLRPGDYRKEGGPPSFQLPVYRRLVASQLAARTALAAYYSVKDGSYSIIWDEKGDGQPVDGSSAVNAAAKATNIAGDERALVEKLDGELEKMLEKMVRDISAGRFAASPAADSRVFRSVTRRRYAVR